ncbi:MAG: tRNA (N6-isopentenyl adenosine(37)-C2)-methylthiotransferase MiaB [Bacillota bacterium]|nr:tRNA (N6-isopentenyl adenosine(37)-C2)-methylthiotransferase MiaB [Bacillota bacterium]
MGKRVYESLPDMAKARNRVDKPNLIKDEAKVSLRLASFAAGRHYLIKTFGCQANVRDEEIMAGYLEKAGFSKAESEESTDLVIINTCAVRENAEDKVYGEIGKFKANRRRDPQFILCVCGCMMQEEGVAKKISDSYPYVNLIFGTHNTHRLLDMLDEHLSRHKDIVNVLSHPGDIIEGMPSARLDNSSAYVNITYGCDKFCTYCIVPYTRGRERSRQKEDILSECRELVEQGYKQITLLGQNVNSYGKDFHDGTSFATILEEVAKLGIPRLRFMTSHPWDFSDEMLEVIAKYPNIMKCIHLPVQSGSTEVLKKMGRRYTREEYLDLVARIKKKIPGVFLTTDIIVGFPNETLEQFEETLSICEEVRYSSAFTFIYSPRKGTPAAKMKDDVPDEEKKARFMRLLKVVEETTNEASASLLGKTIPVLVDGPSKKDPNILSGYSEGSKLVNFPGPAYLKGEIVELKIIENHCHYLVGELLEDPILIKANGVKKALLEEPDVKEYLRLNKQIEENEEIKALQEKIGETQKKLVASLGDAKVKAEYESLREKLDSHPLIQNRESLREGVENLLKAVSGGLS